MTELAFRYPGNSVKAYWRMLGMVAEGIGSRVTIAPEQHAHSKCYGAHRMTRLNHHLVFTLCWDDGHVAFSYKDFVFSQLDQQFSTIQEDCARSIVASAENVAARIRALFPNLKVEVVVE